jgi:hypothetical protein
MEMALEIILSFSRVENSKCVNLKPPKVGKHDR